MASSDLGPAPQMVGAAAEDTIKGDIEVRNKSGDIVVEDAKPVAPDQFEPRYETGKYELWSYYSYYIGNNVSSRWSGMPSLQSPAHTAKPGPASIQLRPNRVPESSRPTRRQNRRPGQRDRLLRRLEPDHKLHHPALQRNLIRDPNRHPATHRSIRRLWLFPTQHLDRPKPDRLRNWIRLAGSPRRRPMEDRPRTVHRRPDRLPAVFDLLDSRVSGPRAQHEGAARAGAQVRGWRGDAGGVRVY